MFISKSSFLIVGLGSSGVASCQRLIKLGASCYIYDESNNETVELNKQKLLMLGAIDASANLQNAISNSQVVVLSPGVPIDNKIPVLARKMKKKIIGELELGYILTSSPIVAITGTNGKTTTSSMIYEVTKKAGEDSYLVGNVGTPICDEVDKFSSSSIVVCEVSSYQLESISSFCPHIGVVLNITPDHLQRHYNMENYIYLKKRMLVNMRESEWAVLNFDDVIVKNFASGLKCGIVYFSTKEMVDGAYLNGDGIYYKGEFIIKKSALPLEGEHNIENVLATICVCKLLKLKNEDICKYISEFCGVTHRIEHFATYDSVDFYDDSKSTNPDATIKAVKSMTKPTVLILGGKDKSVDYDEMFNSIKNSLVEVIVLCGENKMTLYENAKKCGIENLILTNNFESAVKIADIHSCENGAVLLSPASASFDMFKSFEERGKEFKRIVNEIYS